MKFCNLLPYNIHIRVKDAEQVEHQLNELTPRYEEEAR